MVDYSAFAFPKNPPARDKAHLAYVRLQICAVVGNDCGGVTEAAHIGVAGKGIKASDFLTVPLCTKHHIESHGAGVYTFQGNHGVSLWEVAARLLAKRMEER